MGRQVLMKSDNNQIHFFLSDVSLGHSLMSKLKMNAKSLPVLLEWLVKCFLKALEGIPYSRQLESSKLYRNDVQVIIRPVTISRYMLVGIVACWNASSTAS